MLNYNKMTAWITLVALGIVIGSVISTPMYYKKTDDDTYEPDLVPVSSTVIPLYSHQINSTDDAKYHPLSSLDEEYRIAYMKLISHKKHTETPDDPDTLITLTKKYHPDKKNKLKLANSMHQ